MRPACLPLAGLLVAAALLTPGCTGSPEVTAARRIADGDSYLSAGRYRAAAIEYRNAVKAWPQGIEGYLKLGDAQQASDRPADGYRTFIKAIEVAPDDARPRVAAGRLLLAASRLSEARAQAEAALDRDPGDGPAGVLLGITLTRAGEWRQADERLRSAVSSEPGSVQARLALADLLIERGRVDEAEAQLRAAVQVRPGDELANRAMAALLLETSRSDEAEVFLKIAAGAVAQRYRSSLALADFYIARGRAADAGAALDRTPAESARQPTVARAVEARRQALSVY